MRKTSVTCDGCGMGLAGLKNHLRVSMHTHGYGMTDGLRDEKFDICSTACGLKLLKRFIREIESAR